MPDTATVCSCCGAKIKQKNKKVKEPKHIAANSAEKKAALMKKLKIGGIAAGGALLVFVIIILLVIILTDNGLKTAEALADYIGDGIFDARNDSNIKLEEESEFNAVNNAMKFDYLVESEKDVEVDGINFPKWCITICLNDDDEIVTVTHTDFTVCKKNHKGKKAKKEITLSNIVAGDAYKKIKKEIDLDVYSIKYENAIITYTYKYYFIDDSGDEQAVRLAVTYNNDLEYQYHTSTLVYPEDI